MTDEIYDKLLAWGPTGCTGAAEDRDLIYRHWVDGPEGAKFELLVEDHHTDEDINVAKSYLRQNFDVVSILLIKDDEVYK